jgi:hypothetical protein
MTCQARQYGDQRQCAACGLIWDINDPEPPKCKPASRRKETYNQIAARIATELPGGAMITMTRHIPQILPQHLADAMERAYLSGGMHAAYRIFLDSLP